MRVLVLGDLHFKALSSILPNWYDITKATIKQAVVYANNNKIRNIVITGDIFNHYAPSQDDIIKFLNMFENYNKTTFHLYYGNHDKKDNFSGSMDIINYVSKYLPNMRIYKDPEKVTIDGVPVCFLPWPNSKPIKGSILTFAHIPVKGSKTDNGREFADAQEASKETYWIIGDLHTYQKGKNWIFPGSVFQLRNNDSPKRYFLDLKVSKSHKITVQRVRLFLPYVLKALKLEREPDNWKFLDSPSGSPEILWTIYADFTVPFHKNIVRVLPLSKNAPSLELNIASSVSTFEPAEFRNHVKKFLKKNGVSRKKLPAYMTTFESAMKDAKLIS